MEDVSKRCILIKGLPAHATTLELNKCLENRNLQVLRIHSHIESKSDKKWVILLPDLKAAIECIKQGSWRVSLLSTEITVTPDYCSECIVPDDWAQEEERPELDVKDSTDESWTILESIPSVKLDDLRGSCQSHSSEQPSVTPVLGAEGQTADYGAQEKLMLLATENDTIKIFPEEIYQHGKLFQDMPVSEKLRSKDADGTFHSAYFQDVGPRSELFIPHSPKMIGQSTDYTSLKSGSIPIGITQMKYTADQSQTGSQENVTKDTDHDSTQMKTTYVKKGTINLSAKRNPWFPVVDPGVKEEDFNQDRDNQRKSGHGKWHLPTIPSKEKVESEEDDEGQTEVCHSQHHPSSDLEDCDYTMSGLDIQDDHISSQPLKVNSINEKPEVAWSHEDPPVHNERPLSSVQIPSLSGGLEQVMQFSPPDVENKATKGEVPQLTTGISPQRMIIPEPQQNIGRYMPNMTIPQPPAEVPSLNMIMQTPNMKMPQSHAEVTRERQTLPQPNIDTRPPNRGMPHPSTEVPVQGVNLPPSTSWPINPSFIAGQVYSAVPTGHVMPGQLNSSGGTNIRMVPPGHAGPYPYPMQTMQFIPSGGYQMNYGPYPMVHYSLPPQPTVQHVPTTSSHPKCLQPEASFMHHMSPLRPQVGTQHPQGCFSGLEGSSDIAGWRSAASQAGPVEEDGGSVNMTGKPQSISNVESFEQTKTIDRHERVTVEQGPNMSKRDDSDMKEDIPQSQIYPTLTEDQFQKSDMNINSHKRLEGPPSKDDAGRLYSVDSEDYARIKETNDDSDYLTPIGRKTRPDPKPLKSRPRSSAEFPVPPTPGVQKRPLREVDVDIQRKTEQPHGKSVAEMIQSKPQKDQEDDETPRMIRVWGLTKSVSKDALEMFFENKKRCGGGEIESVEWGRNKEEAFITFKDPSVVQSVLEKQEREAFYLEKIKLTVEEYVPPPPDPLRLFLKNLSPKVTPECLSLYLEPRCKATPTEISFGRLQETALVTFSEPPDVKLLLTKVKEKTLEGQYIEVTRVPVTRCVQLTGLPLSITRDTVELYFENAKRSGGGPVADVKFGREKQYCLVSFKKAEDAKKVCMRQHIIDKKNIKVCLYCECLDGDLDTEEVSDLTHGTEDTVDRLKLPDPVELKDLNPQILRFLMKNGKHRQMFEKNLSDLNGVVKWPSSVEDYVIIECTVKVEDKSASLVLKDWTSRVMDKVNNFAAGIDLAEFNLIQMAWPRVLEGLQTVTIDNPEDVGVFVEQDKYNIAVAGPRATVEKLRKTIQEMISGVDTKIALEKTRVRETKKLKTFEIALLRMSHFNQDIEKMYPELQFDLDQKERMAVLVGQADVVQKVMVQMHEKLHSFVSRSMQISKAGKDLLFAKEARKYIKQKMFSQKIIGVWDVVRREEVIMFGRDEKEVTKAIQLVKVCLNENRIPLDEAMAQAVQGQQWSQLLQKIHEKHTGKVAIESDIGGILVVAVDDIFQSVFNEVKAYLDYHAVQENFLALDLVLVKFMKQYKNDDIIDLEKKFEKSLVKLSIVDIGKEKGVKINGTKEGCKTAKIALAEMAKSVFTIEHVMASKVGLKELLQSSRGRDQLSSIEVRWKCFIEMKNSNKPDTWQKEGASGGNTSGSEDDDDQSPEPMDWQPSSESGGASVNVGRIKVSVIKGELAKQKADVIVNSTSKKLDLNTGAISKTILKYGGVSIQKECLQQYPNGINPGQIVVTSGGSLRCTKIYHGCLMSYDGVQGSSMQLMETVVCSCLSTADQSGFQSMAFPALGTGNLAFPSDLVGKLMLRCIKSYSQTNPKTSLRDITLVVYPSDINTIQAFTAVVGGSTVSSASTRKNSSSSSNITLVSGMCRCTFPNYVAMEIVQGDITKETTDAIVNSVLSGLDLTKGQVSKAILTAGGPSIQQECQVKAEDLKTYGFAITRAGSLPCRRIIHMAAQDKREDWEDIIKKVLCGADKLSYKSVSFPALGTGGKGLSPETIAQAMHSACMEFAKTRPASLKQIRVVLFQETMLTTFVQAIRVHSSGQSELKIGRITRRRKTTSSLIFSITTDLKSNAQSAVRDLENFVKSEITEKEIISPREIISKLLDRQITKMEDMGQGKAMVSVKRKKGVILVSGAPKQVLDTYDKIMKYLRNIELDKLKEAQEKLKKQQDMSDLLLPSTWTQMAPNENLKCVSLNPNDKEYMVVSQKFLASATGAGLQGLMYAHGMKYGNTGLTVVKIERVQNKSLYQQYKARKRQLEQQNSGKANEKELWHGTAGTSIPNINHNGFNRSYSGSGSHGNGTYFAVCAAYSVNGYCRVDGSGHRHIYLAHVMTGDSIVAGSGTRVLPPKDPNNPHITYDSTTDNTSNPQMFVIFHDTQAYPSYHITFC